MFEFFRRLSEFLAPYRGRMVLGIVMGVLSGLAEPALMVAVKLVFDFLFPGEASAPLADQLRLAPAFVREWVAEVQVAPGTGGRSLPLTVAVVAVIPTMMVLRGVVGYLNIYLLQWVSVRTIADLRARLFRHLIERPLAFLSTRNTGELISRITNDTNTVQMAITSVMSTVVRDPVKLVSLLAFLVYTQPKLSAVALVVFPACIVPVSIYSRKVRRSASAIQEEYAHLSKAVHETFGGIRIVRAYNLEGTARQQFEQANHRFVSHYMRIVRSMEIPGPLIEAIGSLGVGLLFLYIALAGGNPMSPGEFLQFVGSVFLMYQPVKALTRLHQTLVQARAASARAFELLADRSALPEPAKPKPLAAAGQSITFDRVTFSYGEKRVLDEVSFTLPAGQVLALVGPSGSGKTTVTNLLLRFYDPVEGSVRIGELDLREVRSADLRGQVAVVTQEPILFDESIRYNIELGRPGATEAEIVAAAKHAHAHEFIMEKPDGYDARIGERGVSLSGGQRQRIAIARAILKDAPILILDEATSALDTESERVVQAALEELMKGRTTICIAHRLSTIQKADAIAVMAEGRIVEIGRHSELLAQGGLYRKLHDLQFSG